MTDETLADRIAIRDVVESWVLARDSANWDWFREQWHDAVSYTHLTLPTKRIV